MGIPGTLGGGEGTNSKRSPSLVVLSVRLDRLAFALKEPADPRARFQRGGGGRGWTLGLYSMQTPPPLFLIFKSLDRPPPFLL